MEFHGSKTEENLKKAFTGESEARNKYTFFASKAKEAGYTELAKIYEETANNEKEHAKIWYKHLHDEDISDTIENLHFCIENETYEHLTMYPTYAQVAKDEGFEEIAEHFRLVAKIEGMHQQRFQSFLDDIENKRVFCKDTEIDWECSKCGHTLKSKKAPKKCPVCAHPQGYFIRHQKIY